jgi:hypothetical protein
MPAMSVGAASSRDSELVGAAYVGGGRIIRTVNN